MHIFRKEFRQNLMSILGISLLLTAFMAFVIFLYPSFSADMQGIMTMLNNITFFTDALNFDPVALTEVIGYYGMELEVLIGVMGGVFLAYLGGNLIVKEEKAHTAETLFTWPISRTQIVIEKLLSLVILILIFDAIIMLGSLATIRLTGQEVDVQQFFLIHLAMFLVHLNLGLLSFGITELLPRRASFIGPVVVVTAYLLSIVYNMADQLDWIPWLTPYSYTVTATIIQDTALEWSLVLSNYSITLVVLILGIWRFSRRDIQV